MGIDAPDDSMEMKLRIQALADNELPENEIAGVLDSIQGSYEYRHEYAELLRLKRKLGGLVVEEPKQEWFEQINKRVRRRALSALGTVAFVGSYVGLAFYAVVTVIRRSSFPALVIAALAVGAGGLLALLAMTISDRIRESRSDKYRSVEK